MVERYEYVSFSLEEGDVSFFANLLDTLGYLWRGTMERNPEVRIMYLRIGGQ